MAVGYTIWAINDIFWACVADRCGFDVVITFLLLPTTYLTIWQGMLQIGHNYPYFS